ncbi:hypothetical protein H4R34_001823 [Dimargaris verticillata]|uniref:RGS domain-containing protein n=1 Tax=Dimargaris verticillata TaxID=2761393 RepID=A0A9W8B3P3_9FUNG|nr:hypothetical protein H4R34_001823 [Dimargaris verticillata]
MDALLSAVVSKDLLRNGERATTTAHDGPDIRMKIFAPILAIVDVMIIVSTALFWLRSRTSRDLQKRSVPLTLLTGLAALITCTLFFIRCLGDTPCFPILLGCYFGFYYVHTMLTTRALRLVVMARTARSKVQRLLYPDRPPTFWERHHKLVRVFHQDSKLLAYVFLVSSPFPIFGLIAMFVSDKYSFFSTDISCPMGWESYPLVAVSLVYIFGAFPTLAYMMRDIRDAYQMRNDLIVTCLTSIAFDILFFGLELADTELLYPASNLIFPAISIVIIQVSAILLPWWRVRSTAAEQPGFAASPTVFYRVLADHDMLALFCKFCENNFCAELPLFLTDYQRLKSKSVEFMASEKPIRKSSLAQPRSPIDEDVIPPHPRRQHPYDDHYYQPQQQQHQKHHPQLQQSPNYNPLGKWFITRNVDEKDLVPPTTPSTLGDIPMRDISSFDSIQGPAKVSPLPSTIAMDLGDMAQQTVPTELTVDYYVFYERYFSENSIWEVNISGRTLSQLQSLVEQEHYTWRMFDSAKDEVSQLLMEDVFTKFIKSNRDLLPTV